MVETGIPSREEGFDPHFQCLLVQRLCSVSVLRDRSRGQQSRKRSLQCLLLSFGSKSVSYPYSCCIWKHCLAMDFFRFFFPFFLSSKSCHGHLPKYSDSISSTVNFSFSGVSENNNSCKKTNGRHAAYAAHDLNLLPFLKKILQYEI